MLDEQIFNIVEPNERVNSSGKKFIFWLLKKCLGGIFVFINKNIKLNKTLKNQK
jgi:hypothetical protein